MRVLILAACLAAGCFSPAERDGVVSCGAGDSCPPGFGCWDSLCWRTPPLDAPDGRTGATDARAPIADATAPDAARPDARPLPACGNGLDDDCDGVADDDDPGCQDQNDADERGGRKCDNGEDDDGDGAIDFVADSRGGGGDTLCDSPSDDDEDD